MPYIAKEDRVKFEKPVQKFADNIETDGDLNYCISLLMHKVLKKRGVKYQNMNNIMGAIDCAKTEFYRTVASPYEDKKKAENGNVSELDKIGYKTDKYR
jgi:hypothetical protein